MKTLNQIKKVVFTSVLLFCLSVTMVNAQNDTIYFMKNGLVVYKQSIKPADIDSIIFYQPNNPLNIQTALIPAGVFNMGSPSGEASRFSNETQYSVALSEFRMSKYEITNVQYAAFLNAKGIGSNAKYAGGAYPTQTLIYASAGAYDWGLHFNGSRWVPVAGFENHPVINVTWFGATEFATYAGGTLPTEAQWEYACRAGSLTPFNTGNCLTNLQANYLWSDSYNNCNNTTYNSPRRTQAVGTYAANAWGLHDMHGNVWEWCSDWYGSYPSTFQINPTGPTAGTYRLIRGGSWNSSAWYCRSAIRHNIATPEESYYTTGFRIVLEP